MSARFPKKTLALLIAVVVVLVLFFTVISLPWAIIFTNTLFSLILLIVFIAILVLLFVLLRRSGRRK